MKIRPLHDRVIVKRMEEERKTASVKSSGLELTLRTALEPWHVMGEEGAPGGTAR